MPVDRCKQKNSAPDSAAGGALPDGVLGLGADLCAVSRLERELAARGRKQLEKAVPYALEDELAEEVDEDTGAVRELGLLAGELGVVLIAVLNLFGIETTSLIAVFASAGLAIGLAMQGTLSNFAAGVMLAISFVQLRLMRTCLSCL